MTSVWGAARSDPAPVDQVVTIAMRGSCVVMRPTGELDEIRTGVLADALNAAVATGSVVTVERAGSGRGSGDASDFPVVSHELTDPATHTPPIDAEAVAAGVLRIRSREAFWNIDVVGGRFCRTDKALDVHFLGHAAWCPYTAVWVTATTVTMLTATGCYITGRRTPRLRALVPER